MSEKHPGPLVVEGKLTDAERMKHESNYLRGTIAEDLNDGLTGGFKGDNFLLIRFHGMYQQDDRDIRAELRITPRLPAVKHCCRWWAIKRSYSITPRRRRLLTWCVSPRHSLMPKR